jgi:phosphoserine aminotransferase
MKSGGKITEGLFKGETINTPSMLCVADYLDALQWVDSLGGVKATIARSEANLKVIADFVAANDWISFLAKDPATRSNTSVCLSVALPADKVSAMVKLLDTEGVAYDIGAYKDAPAGLRIWCGATVEASDLEALMPWLTWAYQQVQQPASA